MKHRTKAILRSPHFMMMLSALLSAVLLVTALFGTHYAIAWFKNFVEVDNPVKATNFVTRTQYSFDGSSWSTLAAGEPLELTEQQLSTLQLKIQYKGLATAFVRAKVFGSYKNAHTDTYLPQADGHWQYNATNPNWVADDDGYVYYTKLLGGSENNTASTVSEMSYSFADDLGVFEPRLAKPSDASEKQEYKVELYILVDAVQPDRVMAHWGIDSIPAA